MSGLESLDEAIERRAAFLVNYQDQALSDRYLALVDRVRSAEAAVSDSTRLTEVAMRAYFKTLAYKDEYEVARLHKESGLLESSATNFGDSAHVRFHLAPPLLSRKRDSRGRPRKKELGA